LDPKIKTQLDSADATTEILSLLAPVKELSSVAENATNAGLDAACFEKLVVGMERHMEWSPMKTCPWKATK
jgi:hypothetical protein